MLKDKKVAIYYKNTKFLLSVDLMVKHSDDTFEQFDNTFDCEVDPNTDYKFLGQLLIDGFGILFEVFKVIYNNREYFNICVKMSNSTFKNAIDQNQVLFFNFVVLDINGIPLHILHQFQFTEFDKSVVIFCLNPFKSEFLNLSYFEACKSIFFEAKQGKQIKVEFSPIMLSFDFLKDNFIINMKEEISLAIDSLFDLIKSYNNNIKKIVLI